ncbi:MAG: ATP phosphoribosyltransferase [Clostridia bacterium]|nr:ATP phosphoribosyltransferase [Clostridia bacterium]
MEINDLILNRSEKVVLELRGLYRSRGYAPYRMSKFEEYDLYAKNKDFLVSDNVITFTDTSGKLMALKPDVTLSIIKNSKDEPDVTGKVYYNENVYRVSKGSGGFKEIMQVGVECFGKVDEDAVCEVISLAAKSLKTLADDCVLAISDLDITKKIVNAIPCDSRSLYRAINEKNLHFIDSVCSGKDAEMLKELISLYGGVSEIIPKLDKLFSGTDYEKFYEKFRQVAKKLEKVEDSDAIFVDFSVTDDTNYYNGIVFKGFIKNIPTVVLSGGQYDNLMRKMKRKSQAVGFAVYTDALERMEDAPAAENDDFINVALPKGRLGEKVYAMFAENGYECPSILEQNRKLIFENPERGVRYFWVKPSDVAIYVERGAADIGVVGKDILLEYEPDVYELLDLDIGKCRMAVAGPADFRDDTSRTLRVATKFANIAREYYRLRGRDIDIIHLNGSIEIAPILKLSDVIVDIVETGTTLRENNLGVISEIMPISARLIANKSSLKFKNKNIKNIVDVFDKALKEKK